MEEGEEVRRGKREGKEEKERRGMRRKRKEGELEEKAGEREEKRRGGVTNSYLPVLAHHVIW